MTNRFTARGLVPTSDATADMVANVGRLQGGVKLLIEAASDDGLLDVVVLNPRTLRHWAALDWAVFRRNRRVPSMHVLQGARVEVLSDRPQPRQLDASVIDASNRLFAVMHPDAVWLCVPQSAEHPDLAEDADAAARRGSRLIENGQHPPSARHGANPALHS